MQTRRPFPINATINDEGEIVVQIPRPAYRHLALAGCGVKGTGYAGLAKTFKTYGLLDDIENISGTSAGAIAALIIALGYTPDEIYKLLCELPMAKFLEGNHSWWVTPEILRKGWKALVILLKKKHALSSGEEFIKWLQDVIAKKLGKPNATFKDLEDKIAEKQKEGKGNSFKHLFVTATNISLETPESKTFSFQTAPHVELAKAVAASGAFPFVFPPVEIDGCLFSDGGLIKNLPACVFDDRESLPQGYEFNDKGVNPATIAVEIHSEGEIAQIIWGASKKISLDHASDITRAIYNALSQTVDITKVREARTLIALPDGNVDTLQFSIDEKGKLDLISATEQATQEFLENHAGELFSVKVYKNIEQWLESLSIDEIDDLKAAYEEKLENWKPQALPDEPVKEFDPNNPTREQLIEYINFLDQYEIYHKKMKRYHKQQEDILKKQKNQITANLFNEQNELVKLVKPKIKFPNFHINLKLPKLDENSWDARVIKDMEARLQSIKYELEAKHNLLNAFSEKVKQSPSLPSSGLHKPSTSYALIKQMVDCEEYIKFLESDRKDLEVKLNVHANKNEKPRKRHSNIKEDEIKKDGNKQSEDSLRYEIFCNVISKYMNFAGTPSAWKSLLGLINLNHPVLVFQPYNQPENIFHFDLSQQRDQKIFLISLGLHLFTKNRPTEFNLYKRLFHSFYPDNFPTSIKNLAHFFGKNGNELYASLYRIEELMNHFARIENPKNNLLINIDNILKQISSASSHIIVPAKPTSQQYTEKMFKQKGISKSTMLVPRTLQPNANKDSFDGEYEINDPYLTGGANTPLNMPLDTGESETPGWLFKKFTN